MSYDPILDDLSPGEAICYSRCTKKLMGNITALDELASTCNFDPSNPACTRHKRRNHGRPNNNPADTRHAAGQEK